MQRRIAPRDARAVPRLLHGSLDIKVHLAYKLPKKSWLASMVSGVSSANVTGTFVTIQVSNVTVAQTYAVSNNENPVWNQDFQVPVCHEAAEVQFFVKESNFSGVKIIGLKEITAESLLTGEMIKGNYSLLGSNGNKCASGAELRLSIKFTPVDRLTTNNHGPDCYAVPRTYFPLRHGMRVTLYQDAHVPDGCLPDIWLAQDQGLRYQHGRCWTDIYDAIRHATNLIYIAGWSVCHTIQLVRDGSPVQSLGDLLKMKAGEGVRVHLLLWEDQTSVTFLGKDGMMGTRGQETHKFFKGSPVQVLLCPRSAEGQGLLKKLETEKIFTHHQKTVIVDVDAGHGKRKITAFLGGLDLCGGRFDTPSHHLFRTLQTVHKGDYHNPNFSEVDPRGPREPWHDLHSKIDGPAAYDVLKNFEERWLKESKHHGSKTLDDALLSIEGIKDIIDINDAESSNDSDPETWHVQVLRSIDSNSAEGFPQDPREAEAINLVRGNNVLIDTSIHTGYVQAIRVSKHFIYIENQYFIGSSFNWDSNQDRGANNLIPTEIAHKIVNKIKANERFSAYIVIPMWPEGNPTSLATQSILHWQIKTMQMMYMKIYMALREKGLGHISPQDYLNFFCLGNREVLDSSDTSNVSKTANKPQEQARKNGRFMVYVHSKAMIVDDAYVIIGSANINQRSMEGTRDTEIAMGAYQPHYTWKNKVSGPRGQIYGFRKSLWAEHIGHLEEAFDQPESLECVRLVRQIGEENWRQYMDDKVTEMTGHLMKYPVTVSVDQQKGKVELLPECPTFPDLGGNILGSCILGFKENLTI